MNKKELNGRQKKLIKDFGLHAICLQAGQVARYRESIYLWEVVDIYEQYTKEEVLDICANHVERADLPISTTLHLSQTVMEFKQLSPHCYLYKCGHDYTD
jgi:hypothetical protein